MDLNATVEMLGNVGEFLGAIGVVISLVFVGYSITQNTKATRAQTHQAITQSFMSLAEIISTRPDAFAAGVRSSAEEFAHLSEGDKTFFISSVFGMFKYFELMFLEHRNGNTDDESWNAWSQHILMHFHQRGVQTWWNLRKETFHPDFRAFLDNSAPPNMRSFADLLRPSASA
jgi:hypothetical protein